MINPELLSKSLCSTFCASVSVNPVPCGYAVSTIFTDNSGDPISFYITETKDGVRLEDDGEYLTLLIGSGVSIDRGKNGNRLNAILGEGGAFWNRDTFEIQSEPFDEANLARRAFSFLTALIQIRNMAVVSPAAERSRFREDATEAIRNEFCSVANFFENEPVDEKFSDFSVDLIIRPISNVGMVGALYFVSSNEKLSEALLLQMDSIINRRDADLKVVAVIEDSDFRRLSKSKFQRAQNRSLAMPIFRGDEVAAIGRIGREVKLTANAI